MRVLLTTDTIGGVWTYTKELTAGLLLRGHAVALVSLGRSPSRDQRHWTAQMTNDYPNSFEYTAADTPLEWMDKNEFAFAAGEKLLTEVAQSFRADLLHSNQFCFGSVALSIPKLVVAHSDVLSWADATRPSGLDPSPWLDRYKVLVQDGLSGAAAVVAPTQWMLSSLADHFVIPNDAFVILNGRDISSLKCEVVRQVQAVTVGRLWDEAKGVAMLADVLSPVPIVVAGELEHEHARAPECVGEAALLGLLNDVELLKLFHSSSMYLALSIYEPFGLAPLEAALCGCAILARDIPSFREVWVDAALYFGDAAELSSLLSRINTDSNLLGDLQNRALACALTLNQARMTEQYIDLYQRLLAPHSSFRSPTLATEVAAHVF